MRILCLYFDEEPDFLASDPEIELYEHKVTIAHTFDQAISLIKDPSRGIPPFDLVLSDVVVPRSEPIEEQLGPAGPCLMPYIDHNLIRGLGIFIPDYYESSFNDHLEGYHAIVGSKDCWNPSEKRDWRKLVDLLVKKIEELDQIQ